MKIHSVNRPLQSFKAATVNINAFSDTHGELLLANNALEEMKMRQQDIFCREGKGRANVMAICGDWFMDGGRKGYLTNPEKANAYFQLDIFNELVSEVRKIAGNTSVLFTPGNHDFDGGVKLLDDVFSQIDADVIMTNLDIEKSDGFSKSIHNNKIFNEKVVEVEDDKNPNLKHKLLFLGVAPVNLQMYQRNLDGVGLTDNVAKSQKYVERDDYTATFELCKEKIQKFKDENPNGIVIFMSHTGVGFADNLAEEAPVDIIFDGHEHKEDVRVVNAVPIIPLSQNFKKIVNAKLKIDDDGLLKSIRLKGFNPTNNRSKGPLLKLYCRLFRKDIRKTYSISADNPDVSALGIQNVRTGNNFLANFVTDTVLSEIKKKDETVDFFALNSSSIRHPLKVSNRLSVTPFEVMNVLAGIKEEEAKIMTTEVTGLQLTDLVLDNFVFNREEPQKNPLIHYSGLSIDRTRMLEDYDKGIDSADLYKYITDKNTNRPIEPGKVYKIANAEKYFNKSQNPEIRKLKDKSIYTGDTVQQLFKKHFTDSAGRLRAECDIRIK